MAASHTLTTTWASGGGTLSVANTLTGTSESNIYDETVATAVTDGLINWTCDVSQIKLLWINSTQDVSMETNAADHAGGEIIALKADIPFVMFTNYYDYAATDVLTIDVTKLYITNVSGSTATINIRCLLDSTP